MVRLSRPLPQCRVRYGAVEAGLEHRGGTIRSDAQEYCRKFPVRPREAASASATPTVARRAITNELSMPPEISELAEALSE